MNGHLHRSQYNQTINGHRLHLLRLNSNMQCHLNHPRRQFSSNNLRMINMVEELPHLLRRLHLIRLSQLQFRLSLLYNRIMLLLLLSVHLLPHLLSNLSNPLLHMAVCHQQLPLLQIHSTPNLPPHPRNFPEHLNNLLPMATLLQRHQYS